MYRKQIETHSKTLSFYRVHLSSAAAILIIVLLSTNIQFACAQSPCDNRYWGEVTHLSDSFPGSCTTFAASYGDTVLFGNNEDFNNPNTYIWTISPKEGTYGGVYFGYMYGHPQGGINEKGLAFDGLALPPAPLNYHPEWSGVGGSFTQFWATVMASSSTVEEAIQRSTNYNWGRTISHQIFIADATGDSAVISAGTDGELAVTRKPIGDGYLVATNFNLANPDNTDGSLPCWRYETASTMLKQIQDKGSLTVDSYRQILNAVHVEGSKNNTLYSNVFDLQNGEIYLYYWHQFNEVIILNVGEEIARPSAPMRIHELFSSKTVGKAEKELLRYQGKIPLVEEYFVFGWYILTGIIILIPLRGLIRDKKVPLGMKFAWLLTFFFLGPIGMFLYWLSYRRPQNAQRSELSSWKRALGGSAISATGYATSFLILLVCFYFFLPQGSSGGFSLIVPFLIGLLIFRAPLLASLTGSKYSVIVRKSILVEIISTVFAVAGIILVNTLMIQHLGDTYQNVLNPGQALFWGTLTLYGLTSLAVIYPFHHWLAWRGFSIWPDGFNANGEISKKDVALKYPSLRKAGLFLLISIAFLLFAAVSSS